jgi:hypothetical protein
LAKKSSHRPMSYQTLLSKLRESLRRL